MKFQMSQPIESNLYFYNPEGNPMSPMKNMAAPSPAKTHAHEMHEKAGSISHTRARAPLWDDM